VGWHRIANMEYNTSEDRAWKKVIHGGGGEEIVLCITRDTNEIRSVYWYRYVCIYTCIYVYIYICVYVYISIYTCTNLDIYIQKPHIRICLRQDWV